MPYKKNILNIIQTKNEGRLFEMELVWSFMFNQKIMNSEIYSCLLCDDICGRDALLHKQQVIFHICFNCVTLYEQGYFDD